MGGRMTHRLMVTITRESKLRALKAYGLRARGLKFREIALLLGRRDVLSWRTLPYRDRPITRAQAQALAQKGASIVVRWYSARRRWPPASAQAITQPRIVTRSSW